jgi:NADPH-dependent glutamate synthase beta subunit-like oxidoreductase
VAVHALERFVSGQARPDPAPGRSAARPRRLAIFGSGPAGLAAAAFLARLGHACEIFEAASEPGGLLRWGIPAYRLPAAVLAREIEAILALGVKLHCGAPRDGSLAGFDALLAACGQGRSLGLGVPGAELARDGLELLRAARTGPARPAAAGARAAVIGGGNTAIDVARTLLRQGLRPVIVYRRRREDMPAFAPELERALAEGAELLELHAPLALGRGRAGLRLTLQKMRSLDPGPDGRRPVTALPDAPVELLVDEVYGAVGAEPDPAWLELMAHTPATRLARCSIAFGPAPVAFIGDLGPAPKSVSEAIASGKEAALALDAWFAGGAAAVAALAACRVGAGPALSMASYLGTGRARSSRPVRFAELNPAYFVPAERAEPPVLAAAGFGEVEGGLEPAAAEREAGRCFSCGTCNGCDNCRTFCPDVAVRLELGARRIDTGFCKGCGVCVEECPRGAMAMGAEEGRP